MIHTCINPSGYGVKIQHIISICGNGIDPKMREGRMIELGELFTEPLTFVTPRSEFDPSFRFRVRTHKEEEESRTVKRRERKDGG